MIGLSKLAAMERAPHGMEVLMTRVAAVEAPAGARAPSRAIHELAIPGEIANFICDLLSDAASYGTGGVDATAERSSRGLSRGSRRAPN